MNGSVYLLRDKYNTELDVTIKVLPKVLGHEDEMKERLKQLANCENKNIARVVHISEDFENFYLAVESVKE